MTDMNSTACTGRVMTITINAMSRDDAFGQILQRAGDIDFSLISPEAIEIDDLNDGMAPRQAQEANRDPGGYEARLLRVAYHSGSGSETDSDYYIEDLSGPGPFYLNPMMVSRHPDMEDIIRATRQQEALEAGTPGTVVSAGGPAPRM